MTSKTGHGDILAIITARKGSVGLPGKNLRELAGKPLIAHTIVAARDCPLVGRVVVSSDDQGIGDVSKAWGADFIRRPDELATATARPEDAVRHVLETLDREGSAVRTVAFMQPTTPLRTADQVTGCIEAFQAAPECRSAVTVYEARHPPFNSFTLSDGMLAPLFDPEVLLQQRQSLPAVYRSNGAVYVIDREVFLEYGTFFVPPTVAYVMPEEDSVDIDTKADFDLAEFYMARRGGGS